MNPHNEKDLVERLVQGDEKAFRAIFYAHHQRIGAFVMEAVNSVPVAEELVHDIFLKLWINREKLVHVEQFRAYLYAIARNHVYSYLKKQARELQKKQQWLATDPVPELTWQQPANDYFKNLLEYAINDLPAQQQKVYLLSRDEGLSHDGIAQKLGVSLETVKKHMVLALKRIRHNVSEHKNKVISSLIIFFIFLLRRLPLLEYHRSLYDI